MVTNNKKIYELAKNLRNQSFSSKRHFWHKRVGFNYRMTNLQAAIGLAQTENLENIVKKRINNAKIYNAALKKIQGITLPPNTKDIRNVYWMYTIIIEKSFGMSAIKLRYFLAQYGIETRSFFIPLHLQPIYFKKKYEGQFPVAEKIFKKSFYLPSSSHLTKKDINYIVEIINLAKSKKIVQ